MLNNVILMGRLVATPELRTTPSGVSVCSFTVAVDRRFQSSQASQTADFINCIAWRQTAEFVTRYFSKGSMIAVQGAIQTGSYEKDGIKRSTFEIVADNVSFCGSKSESSTGGAPRMNDTAATSFSNGSINDFAAVADDDDLPF